MSLEQWLTWKKVKLILEQQSWPVLPGGGQHGGNFSLSELVPDVGAGEGDKM